MNEPVLIGPDDLITGACRLALIGNHAEYRELMSEKYPCPCCGYRTFDEPPGSYDICPVCFWEDDMLQLRWPRYQGGANRPSLVEAQRAFAESGEVQWRVGRIVRPPSEDELRDPGWRPVSDEDDFGPLPIEGAEWPTDLTALYWRRPTFWRHQQNL